MLQQEEAARREEILASLARSREELRQLLDPVRTDAEENAVHGGDRAEGFPRSHTMKMLMSGRGLGTLAAVAGGLFIARPALALRLIRMLPAGAVGRWAMGRAVTALRGKRGAANGAGADAHADPGITPASPAQSDSERHPPT
jgi:hypothetical protein